METVPPSPSKVQLKAIHTQLNKLEERIEAIERKISSTKESWSIRFTKFYDHHKIITIITGIVFCIGGGTYNYYLDHRNDGATKVADDEIRKLVTPGLNDLSNKISAMQGTLNELQPLVNELVMNQINKSASQPSSELRNNLPVFKSAVSLARKQDVKVASKTLDLLSAKLAHVETTSEGYWPATAEFISYRSQLVSPDTNQSNLPTCTDTTPPGEIVTDIKRNPDGSPNSITLADAEYSNCKFVIDSLEEDGKVNNILIHKSTGLLFKHCLIVYNGGPINLITALNNNRRIARTQDGQKIFTATISRSETLHFQDCIFEWSLKTEPDEVGKYVTKEILNQPSNNVILPIHTPSS